jgi:hypothetical protein
MQVIKSPFKIESERLCRRWVLKFKCLYKVEYQQRWTINSKRLKIMLDKIELQSARLILSPPKSVKLKTWFFRLTSTVPCHNGCDHPLISRPRVEVGKFHYHSIRSQSLCCSKKKTKWCPIFSTTAKSFKFRVVRKGSTLFRFCSFAMM